MRMLTMSSLFLLSVLSVMTQAQSGQGHFHGTRISEEEAKTIAANVVTEFVENEKIDSSWHETEATTIEQKTFDGHLEWIVTFQNDAIEDQDKRTLYIFLTLGGELTGANYTGD